MPAVSMRRQLPPPAAAIEAMTEIRLRFIGFLIIENSLRNGRRHSSISADCKRLTVARTLAGPLVLTRASTTPVRPQGC